MTEVAVTEALGELLSLSQANTYLTCPAKWYFRYLVGLSEPTTGALALRDGRLHTAARFSHIGSRAALPYFPKCFSNSSRDRCAPSSVTTTDLARLDMTMYYSHARKQQKRAAQGMLLEAILAKRGR